MRARFIPLLFNPLKEVVPAVELALPRETLLVQRAMALGAFDALDVPRLVQHLHEVALHDRLVAAGADKGGDHFAPSRPPGSTRSLYPVRRSRRETGE